MSLSFCWTSGPGLEGAEHLEQVQELQKAGCGSAKKRRTFHGKCVEIGDQMLINQHQLWDFSGCRIRPQMGVTWGNLREMVCRWQKGTSFEILSWSRCLCSLSLEPWGLAKIPMPRNSEIFRSEVHPGYCGGPWQLAGYPLKCRAFWPPHGLVVVLLRRWNVWISDKQIGSTWPLLYYLYCKADFHTIQGLVLFWHEYVMSIAYFQIAEESSNCCNEKDYFPGFF